MALSEKPCPINFGSRGIDWLLRKINKEPFASPSETIIGKKLLSHISNEGNNVAQSTQRLLLINVKLLRSRLSTLKLPFYKVVIWQDCNVIKNSTDSD